MQGIFVLFLHRLRPAGELVDAAIARMRAIPGNLEDGKRNLRPELVPAIFLDRAANQARAGARYVREILPAQVRRRPPSASWPRRGRRPEPPTTTTWPSSRRCVPSATGEFALGEERYSALLREKELLGFGARELRERGQAAYEELAGELARCARELRGTDDWHDRPATSSTRITRARRRRCASGTRSGPSARAPTCASTGWSASRRASSAPSCRRRTSSGRCWRSRATCSRRRSATGCTATSSSRSRPTARREEEVQKRLASNSYPGIPTTAVHEAYPGHHWHLVMSKANPIAPAAGLPHALLQRGLGALRRADDARAGLLHRPAPRDDPARGDDLPRGAHRGRHLPAHGRDDAATRR